MEFLSAIRQWIETNIGVGGAFAVLCVLVFLFVFGFRKLFPNAWIWLVKRVPYLSFDEQPILAFLDKTVQALPGTVFAAVVAALSTGGNVKAAALASLAGPLMAVAHHIMQAIPWIPYLGKLGARAKKRFTPTTGITGGVLAICLFLGGCKPGTVSWPAVVERCAPSSQDAISLVTNILLAGAANFKSQMDDAALKYGPEAVLCISKELVNAWGAPGSASMKSARVQAARLRGEEFIKSTGAKVGP